MSTNPTYIRKDRNQWIKQIEQKAAELREIFSACPTCKLNDENECSECNAVWQIADTLNSIVQLLRR